MKSVCIITALAALLAASPVLAQAPVPTDEAATSTLSVTITGLKSEQGKVRVILYDSAETFPTKRDKALATLAVPINGHQARARFPDLAPGDYAVAAYHDEDNNGRMKRSVIGIPREGTAASRDPKPRMGPPRWKDCVLHLEPGETEIKIGIKY